MAIQSVADPRLRVSRLDPLVLTTSWQTLDYTGSESLNINTFGQDSVTSTNLFNWDSTNKLFKYSGNYDHNFQMFLQFSTTTTLLSIRATLQLRFVIPNGISAGVDFIFPFANNGGYADLDEVTVLAVAQNNKPFSHPLYTNQAIRTNGLRVDVRISNALAIGGTTTLNYTSILIQGVAKE